MDIAQPCSNDPRRDARALALFRVYSQASAVAAARKPLREEDLVDPSGLLSAELAAEVALQAVWDSASSPIVRRSIDEIEALFPAPDPKG